MPATWNEDLKSLSRRRKKWISIRLKSSAQTSNKLTRIFCILNKSQIVFGILSGNHSAKPLQNRKEIPSHPQPKKKKKRKWKIPCPSGGEKWFFLLDLRLSDTANFPSRFSNSWQYVSFFTWQRHFNALNVNQYWLITVVSNYCAS